MVLGLDADALIQHPDRGGGALPAAADQHVGTGRILDRVRDQVLHHDGQQAGIGIDHDGAVDPAQADLGALDLGAVLMNHVADHLAQRHRLLAHHDLAAVERRDIEQRAQHPRHAAQRMVDIIQHVRVGLRQVRLAQAIGEQPDRMDGLTQVVAGMGQEPRLGQIGPVGGAVGFARVGKQRIGVKRHEQQRQAKGHDDKGLLTP